MHLIYFVWTFKWRKEQESSNNNNKFCVRAEIPPWAYYIGYILNIHYVCWFARKVQTKYGIYKHKFYMITLLKQTEFVCMEIKTLYYKVHWK